MREFCLRCRKAKITCYCDRLRPFSSDPQFVILLHPREARNSVGTGRMLHLSLLNSILIQGHDFSRNEQVNALISNPENHAAVLYPGQRSLNLSSCSTAEAASFTPMDKKLVIFVIDGTWDLARGMINRSANLKALPQLRFTPEKRSAYQIRQQPKAHCLSTLESVHWMISRFAVLGLYPAPPGNVHDSLIEVFQSMVGQQLAFGEKGTTRTDGPRAPLA